MGCQKQYGMYQEHDLLDMTVQEYVAEKERLGQEAFRTCSWLQRALLSGEIVRQPHPSAVGLQSRHYVAGSMSPLMMDRYMVPMGKGRGVAALNESANRPSLAGGSELCWAVYFAEYSRNDANTVHGGAIAAVCDYIGASINGTTAWLRVDYLKAPTKGESVKDKADPIVGATDETVWKLCAWISEVKQRGRRKKIQVELSDGDTGVVYCTAEGEFVDTTMPRPPRL